MITELFNRKLQKELEKKKQGVIRLRWEKLRFQSAVEKMKQEQERDSVEN